MARSHPRRALSRVVVSACMTLFGLALWQPVGWTQGDTASPGEDEISVVTDVEAWYHTSPLPVGELPVVPPPASPYDEHTLHVRITNGQENARTYVSLDVTDLPITSKITGGVLILPLLPTEADIDDDKTALFQVCLADPLAESVSGSFEAPPEVDCEMRAVAIYESKPEPRFIVDLGPLVDGLETSSLALLPTDSAREQTHTWHVAFYGKKNESEDATPITAELEIVAVDTGGVVAPPDTAPPAIDAPASGGDSGFGSSSLNFGSGSLASDSTDVANGASVPPSEDPQELAAPAVAPVVASGPTYTVVWALPLIMLLLGGYFSSALTRQVVVGKRRR